MTLDVTVPPVRSFSAEADTHRLLSLYEAVEAFDQAGMLISEEDLMAQLSLPGHDPLEDRWVIGDPKNPSALIGSALIHHAPRSETAEADIIVHPSWRQHGIGDMLLSRVIARTHHLNACAIQVYADTRQKDTLGFLHDHGFLSLGAYTELRLVADVRLPPVIWPFGYTYDPYSQVMDISILTQAINLSYIPLWGHQEVSEGDVSSRLPNFNHQGLFLVFSEKGRVIGISRTEPSPDRSKINGVPTGYIDAPGIVPQHRRLDLYRALVLTGIRWLRDQGCTLVEMESWGVNWRSKTSRAGFY
jgi:GNAT superfamily N-acetyltransferase